uniref:Uncharacterized protein n=1 Tax=Rhizophora mucronata TaxID=61149 RepID=A0A2P2PF44_RHIMU
MVEMHENPVPLPEPESSFQLTSNGEAELCISLASSKPPLTTTALASIFVDKKDHSRHR